MSTPTSQRMIEPRPSRLITRLQASVAGPALICITALHGNEPAGVAAVERVAAGLALGNRLRHGTLWGLIGNLPALALRRRFVDRDLNRGWGDPTVAAPSDGSVGTVEDKEQIELWGAIEFANRHADGQVFLLDLHTTSGHGKPFTVFADTLACRTFALELPCPIILGLEEHLDGTLIDYATTRGLVAIAVEGGQHDDIQSVDALEAAIWLALRACRMIDHNQEVSDGYALLKRASAGLPHAVEVRARHAITQGDGFRMHQGFSSFDCVEVGQLLAADRTGEIQAPQTGYLLMPLYQEQGDDGFFIVTTVRRFWLILSRWLRKARAHRIVSWLPGVRQHPTNVNDLLVDRHVARWFALELLHLLGYRKLGETDGLLHVTRQHHVRSY